MFRARTAQNVVIVVGLQWSGRILAILTKVVLVRLLFPADFGVFTLASGLIGFIGTFGNFGLDFAIIQKGDGATEDDYDAGMSLRLLISVGLFLVSFALAGPWASLYASPIVAPTSQVLAFGYLVGVWSFVPATRLSVELRYRAIAIPNLVGQVSNAAVSIGLAFAGFGVWSLVLGTLLSQVATTVAYSAVRSWRFRLTFRSPAARPLLTYARHLVAAAFLGFLITNIDNFAVGYFLGTAALGLYSVAYGFGTIPGQLVSGPAASALFPSLSKVRDIEVLRQGYLESFGYVIGVVAPTAIGLAVVAPEVANILLGPTWAPATPSLFILAFYGFARAPIDFSGALFSAVGRPRIVAELNFYVLVASILPLVPLTLAYGIAGTAIAMTVPVVLVSVVSIVRSAQVLRTKVRDFAARSVRAILAAGAMGLAVFGLRAVLYKLLPSRIPIFGPGVTVHEATIVLIAGVTAGTIVYFSLLWVLDRALVRGLVQTLRLAVGGRNRFP
jgi:O-antigen/teichoic acid export membrane protein